MGNGEGRPHGVRGYFEVPQEREQRERVAGEVRGRTPRGDGKLGELGEAAYENAHIRSASNRT